MGRWMWAGEGVSHGHSTKSDQRHRQAVEMRWVCLAKELNPQHHVQVENREQQHLRHRIGRFSANFIPGLSRTMKCVLPRRAVAP